MKEKGEKEYAENSEHWDRPGKNTEKLESIKVGEKPEFLSILCIHIPIYHVCSEQDTT